MNLNTKNLLFLYDKKHYKVERHDKLVKHTYNNKQISLLYTLVRKNVQPNSKISKDIRRKRIRKIRKIG